MALQSPETQQWSDSVLAAARAATECADWCIHQGDAELSDCIRLCLDTATIATAASRVLVRESEHEQHLLRACRTVTETCAKECGSHGDMHDSMTHCTSVCQDATQAVDGVLQGQRR